MLRVASIGLGWWANELASAVGGKTDLIDISACYSTSESKRRSFSEKFSAEPHSSYRSVLQDSAIDAVLLTTPHSLHVEQIIEAARYGKHIFVEKPLALTTESSVCASSACDDAGVILAVGHNRRFSAGVQYLINAVTSDELGRILHVETNFSAPSALKWEQDYWRASRRESPAGGLAGLGIHMIDLMGVFGGGVMEVTAFSTRLALKIDVDDTTCAVFRLRSGATGYLGTMCVCPYSAFVNLYGTKANAFLSIDKDQLAIQRMGQEPEQVDLEPVDTLLVELEEFAAACQFRERQFRVSPDQAIHNVAVMEAVTKSTNQGGSPVRVTRTFGEEHWKH